nr:MAG TPA: hypothetical protein [Bacteriophage sp.]
MNIKTILYTIIIFCAIGITGTYAFGESDIRYYDPAPDSPIINPDETPTLMRSFGKLEVYRLMRDSTCTGLIIADNGARVYQRLTDIACEQPKVMSVSIHPLSVGNYTAVDFFHNAELIGRVTLNRPAE